MSVYKKATHRPQALSSNQWNRLSAEIRQVVPSVKNRVTVNKIATLLPNPGTHTQETITTAVRWAGFEISESGTVSYQKGMIDNVTDRKF